LFFIIFIHHLLAIHYIKRKDIDRAKYDGCVHYAHNHLVYAYSWYLDNVTNGQWDVLVEDDYVSVMPLPWNDKLLGIKQVYQPFLSQQLGVFSVKPITIGRIQIFMAAIPSEFKRITIALNEQNKISHTVLDFEIKQKLNLVLNLNQNYEDLEAGYSNNLKRKLKTVANANLTLTTDIKPEVLVEMIKKYHIDKKNGIPDALYHTALRIIYNSLHRGIGMLSGVRNEKGDLIAAAFFIYSKDRIINLLNVSTAEGKEKNGMSLIFDMLIRSFAQKPIYLDFEGSSIPGIAEFYKRFGPQEVYYSIIEQNTLPWWLKWWKK
jgi:hypothetical protein